VEVIYTCLWWFIDGSVVYMFILWFYSQQDLVCIVIRLKEKWMYRCSVKLACCNLQNLIRDAQFWASANLFYIKNILLCFYLYIFFLEILCVLSIILAKKHLVDNYCLLIFLFQFRCCFLADQYSGAVNSAWEKYLNLPIFLYSK